MTHNRAAKPTIRETVYNWADNKQPGTTSIHDLDALVSALEWREMQAGDKDAEETRERGPCTGSDSTSPISVPVADRAAKEGEGRELPCPHGHPQRNMTCGPECLTHGWNIDQILTFVWQMIAEDQSEHEYPFKTFNESNGGRRLRIELEALAASQPPQELEGLRRELWRALDMYEKGAGNEYWDEWTVSARAALHSRGGAK
jgi:hypothetical protein